MSASCDHQVIDKVEKRRVYQWEGQFQCTFTFDELEEKNNILVETILGLNDSVNVETTLHLYENGEFRVTRDDKIALIGDWRLNNNQLMIVIEQESWNLEIETKNADSLVLFFNGYYKSIRDLHLVLKH